MSQPATFLLITQFEIQKGFLPKVIEKWYHAFGGSSTERRLYQDATNHSLVELRKLSNLSFLAESSKEQKEFEASVRDWMESDWRSQCLELKDVVIPQKDILPNSPYLQLRRIEVPLRVYDAYMAWRVGTIFDYSKKHSAIESFLAYHSVLSTTPGVMFVCGFSCEKEKYLQIFAHSDFQAISNEAKKKYIYAGASGLHTHIYSKTEGGSYGSDR